jgi:hypothetical protein
MASQTYYSISEVRSETWNLAILFSKKILKKINQRTYRENQK